MSTASLTNVQAQRTVAAKYEFAVHGGAVGSIPLRIRIPKGAIVTHSFAHVLTAPTSGGSATIALSVESAGDMFAADDFDGSVWGAPGFYMGAARYTPAIDLGSGDGTDTAIDDSASAAFVLTTAERELTMTIGTAALTAGKINFFITYVVNAVA